MTWTKKDLEKIKGKVKKVNLPLEQKNKVVIPKSEGKEKLFIENTLKMFFALRDLEFEKEYRFDEVRKFRFDWAIPSKKIAIEYEGVFSSKSRHTTIDGYTKDCEKYNLAVQNGWKVLRYTAKNYKDFENDLRKLLLKENEYFDYLKSIYEDIMKSRKPNFSKNRRYFHNRYGYGHYVRSYYNECGDEIIVVETDNHLEVCAPSIDFMPVYE